MDWLNTQTHTHIHIYIYTHNILPKCTIKIRSAQIKSRWPVSWNPDWERVPMPSKWGQPIDQIVSGINHTTLFQHNLLQINLMCAMISFGRKLHQITSHSGVISLFHSNQLRLRSWILGELVGDPSDRWWPAPPINQCWHHWMGPSVMYLIHACCNLETPKLKMLAQCGNSCNQPRKDGISKSVIM